MEIWAVVGPIAIGIVGYLLNNQLTQSQKDITILKTQVYQMQIDLARLLHKVEKLWPAFLIGCLSEGQYQAPPLISGGLFIL